MYRKSASKGRPAHYVTWFSLWMEAHHFTLVGLARLICYSEMSVVKWRRGDPVGRHAAQLLRARWEDCPVHAYGGPAAKVTEKLPINARTPLIYKCLLSKAGMIPEGTIPAIELERARGIPLQPK